MQQGKIQGCSFIEPSFGPGTTTVTGDDPTHARRSDAWALEFFLTVQAFSLFGPGTLMGLRLIGLASLWLIL